MNTGQRNAAITAPNNGPTIYIHICFIGSLFPPAITCIRAGPKDLAGFNEQPETFPPTPLKAIKTEEKANPKVGPK